MSTPSIPNVQNSPPTAAPHPGKPDRAGGEFAIPGAEKSAGRQDAVRQRSAETIALHNAAMVTDTVDAREEFREFLGKDPAERMREVVLLALGITEEQLEALPADERAKMERKISQIIEERMRLAAEEELQKTAVDSAGVDPSADAACMLEKDEEEWLAALGLPENGKVRLGFTPFGEMKMTADSANVGPQKIP